MGWGHVSSLLGVNLSSDEKSEEAIKIMSYNTHNFYYLRTIRNKKIQKSREKKLTKWLEKINSISILCAQELKGSYVFFDKNLCTFIHSINHKILHFIQL